MENVTGISSETAERALSAKLYIELKFSALKTAERHKHNESALNRWEALNGKNFSDIQKELLKQEIMHQEALQLRRQRQRLSTEDFTPLAVIGKGAYGEVRLCRFTATGELVAMKRMKKREMQLKNQIRHIKSEKDVLARAQKNP